MTDTTTPAATVYHWIITVQLGNGNLAQASGTYNVYAPTTRSTVFAWAQDAIFEQIGTRSGSVVFFDLAPNTIAAPKPPQYIGNDDDPFLIEAGDTGGAR